MTVGFANITRLTHEEDIVRSLGLIGESCFQEWHREYGTIVNGRNGDGYVHRTHFRLYESWLGNQLPSDFSLEKYWIVREWHTFGRTLSRGSDVSEHHIIYKTVKAFFDQDIKESNNFLDWLEHSRKNDVKVVEQWS